MLAGSGSMRPPGFIQLFELTLKKNKKKIPPDLYKGAALGFFPLC